MCGRRARAERGCGPDQLADHHRQRQRERRRLGAALQGFHAVAGRERERHHRHPGERAQRGDHDPPPATDRPGQRACRHTDAQLQEHARDDNDGDDDDQATRQHGPERPVDARQDRIAAPEQPHRECEPTDRTEHDEHDRPRALTHPQVLLGIEHGGDRRVIRSSEGGGDARCRKGHAATTRPATHHRPQRATRFDDRRLAADRNQPGRDDPRRCHTQPRRTEGDVATLASRRCRHGLDAGAVRPTTLNGVTDRSRDGDAASGDEEQRDAAE
jgi:hypothetical protein